MREILLFVTATKTACRLRGGQTMGHPAQMPVVERNAASADISVCAAVGTQLAPSLGAAVSFQPESRSSRKVKAVASNASRGVSIFREGAAHCRSSSTPSCRKRLRFFGTAVVQYSVLRRQTAGVCLVDFTKRPSMVNDKCCADRSSGDTTSVVRFVTVARDERRMPSIYAAAGLTDRTVIAQQCFGDVYPSSLTYWEALYAFIASS